MQERTFTFRVDDELKTAFASAAKQQDRTAAQLLRDFMRHFVAESQKEDSYDIWFRQKVAVGMQAYEDGRVVSHEVAKAEAAKRRQEFLDRQS